MKLYVVGFGCGSRSGMTIEAETAIEKSSLIVGYTVYTEIIKNFFPDKKIISTGMRHERERVKIALEEAKRQTVALVCSGDSVVYGMAGLALEMSVDYPDVDVEVVSGVTSAISGSSILGSPITCDFAVISLSDLLTPAEKIIRRIEYATKADFTLVFYNPSSKNRAYYLKKACNIILESRPPETVCGFVRNIGRNGQESRILTLAQLRETQVDMFTTVFIGNSETVVINGKMVTPRGYRNG
ncbi:MAG: precorrin-3B C(17)-methyltransferase [Ruminococcus sp.]|nr:precorrin-3B C(17)-methyltransferase [Ruminococcus sp.]